MRILVPVDGSSQANAALDFIASRTTLLGRDARIRLINVQPSVSARVARAVGAAQAKAFQRAEADEVLLPAAARLRDQGIAAAASFAVGPRADAIAAAAAKGRADLIVMGSRGHTGLKGVLFGSMANAVLAGCSTPVLMLRSAKAPSKDTLSVGIAIDGSRLADAAVRWVIRHRELFGAQPRIELIHAHEDAATDADPALMPAFEKLMAGPRKRLAKAGIEATPVPLQGASAGDAIAAHARKRRLDMLVMGSHGRGAFQSLVLGSVVMRVAARCELPLLIVRGAVPADRSTAVPRPRTRQSRRSPVDPT